MYQWNVEKDKHIEALVLVKGLSNENHDSLCLVEDLWELNWLINQLERFKRQYSVFYVQSNDWGDVKCCTKS